MIPPNWFGQKAFQVLKLPPQGAGMLSSLMETGGLVELAEDVTRVAPGDSVGFLSYAELD